MAKGQAKSPQEARAERLAAALRDNLKRRKAQARGRAAEADAGAPESQSPAAGRDGPKAPPRS